MNIIKYTHEEFNTYRNNLLKSTILLKLSSLQSIFREFAIALNRPNQSYFSDCNPITSKNPQTTNARNIDNKGLIVFIHGLNSTPETGRNLYKKEIENQAKGKFEVWVPSVPKQGNCSLEEAAKPILEMIEKYIETNPGKPVQLIGHSNGGRIIAYIETHLRNKEVDMRITGIAGAFFGSKLINLYTPIGTTNFFFSPHILRDLKTDSKKSKELINEMRKEVTIGSREYTFYATVNDLAIPNFTSCLPNIQQNEKCHVLKGCGHSDIQKVVCKKEIEKVIDFLRKHKPVNINSTTEITEIPMVDFSYNDLINEDIISA